MSGGMDFNEKIEPIHEMEADELEHALELTKDRLSFLYQNPQTKPKAARKNIVEQVEWNLNTLAHSIKKSLICLFPQHEKLILEIDDANGALWFDQTYSAYPLNEGAQALTKIHLMLMNKPFETDSWAKDEEHCSSEFSEMMNSIEHYKMIAQHYTHEKEKEALEDAFTKAYTKEKSEAGKSDRGAKRPIGIKEAIRQHILEGYKDHNKLWLHFKTKHDGEGKAFQVEEYNIYWLPSDAYEDGCLAQDCEDRKRKPITKGHYRNIFYDVKKESE
jgi:hypothetical protein